ncbi:dephospho-CoA kinase [Propionicimonas sp.]|uniref:dephospho-CoA kinase n=1 Tax=Propionicimonas sp. TaxID=1955623 RepID=UPI00179B9075|nr:dephospho-CoA kinase [Propionicimonas sp.]MBU3977621.1 dephospho-CoA kinase, long form [Actinomycetota bacterium]MBA3021545.1 dephospho-CoA kinase [Propionicimonas sp.]MBU3987095.1 dephospho-CoA kinase, long form [Actinomycetota bacterium]MBU4008916.1 dephospho-CoA kinase, long form [Actinomycetota bacterium]MBU4065934.1 dephospho-CoA kinase, long form [Actinomycetota bacterium]
MMIGLTGGIAAGKSAVAAQLAELGAVIIDSDVLAREVVAPGTPGLSAIVARFGTEVLAADGSLDRPALGRVVFADRRARSDLEAIVHPAVRARAAELAEAAPTGSVIVQVVPLLVEVGMADSFDLVVVVDVEPAVQLARLRSRDQLSDADAVARVSAQTSREQRLARADVVITNNGTPRQLRSAVARFWAERVAGQSMSD